MKLCSNCRTNNTDDLKFCQNCGTPLSIPPQQTKMAVQPKLRATDSPVTIQTERKDMIVTTGDLKTEYEVIGPVYFQISNKGLLSNQLEQLSSQYKNEIRKMREQGLVGKERIDWGLVYGDYSVGQTKFEKAFFIAVQELKKRGKLLEADAIICMRQDIDLDTNGFQYFYLQMYGTAVKFV